MEKPETLRLALKSIDTQICNIEPWYEPDCCYEPDHLDEYAEMKWLSLSLMKARLYLLELN